MLHQKKTESVGQKFPTRGNETMLAIGAARAKKPLVRSRWSWIGHGVREPACGQAAKTVKRVGVIPLILRHAQDRLSILSHKGRGGSLSLSLYQLHPVKKVLTGCWMFKAYAVT